MQFYHSVNFWSTTCIYNKELVLLTFGAMQGLQDPVHYFSSFSFNVISSHVFKYILAPMCHYLFTLIQLLFFCALFFNRSASNLDSIPAKNRYSSSEFAKFFFF